MSEFHFKQFSICQDKCQMKVGTDGVLLGAWANSEKTKLLDIGTGTGLISLMMAQRQPKATITAIEIDPLAAKQAEENCKKSIFEKQIRIVYSDLKSFEPSQKFDHIFCNPPFFKPNASTANLKRMIARQTLSLDFETLLEKASNLLEESGIFSCIIPFESLVNFVELAKRNHLYLNRICQIKGNENRPWVRSLLEFKTKESSIISYSTLIIEKQRHVYSEEYTRLTEMFYLKM
ncbi:MAG: tRNA (adenine-N(6)-)-methyltransferase [Flavobacteriaceae bacterium]|nr:MAG: tRNA (adenine-N(6)-)-methyltransferase [Flavobacteriaceae bacterium]